VLLDMGDGEGVGYAEIDLARISEVRGRIPALDHRQPIGEVEHN
jgi:predicted amidohydrolase